MKPPNFVHVVLNNGAHDSVGGQPTAAVKDTFSVPGLAKACGYSTTQVAANDQEIVDALQNIVGERGPHLIEIKISRGARKNLGRPTRSPVENKLDFMHFVAINGSS